MMQEKKRACATAVSRKIASAIMMKKNIDNSPLIFSHFKETMELFETHMSDL